MARSRLFVTMMSLLLAFALSACGSKQNNDGNGEAGVVDAGTATVRVVNADPARAAGLVSNGEAISAVLSAGTWERSRATIAAGVLELSSVNAAGTELASSPVELADGGSYTLVISTTANGGQRILVIADDFSATTTHARYINAAPLAGAVTVTLESGGVIADGVIFGAASAPAATPDSRDFITVSSQDTESRAQVSFVTGRFFNLVGIPDLDNGGVQTLVILE